jgi:hypothetical protein
MREPAHVREDHVGVVVQRSQHAPDEARVQQRHVGGGHVGGVRPVPDGGQAGRHALQRPAPLAGVLHDLDALWQHRQLLAGRADDDHGPVDRAIHDADDAAQQRRAVPLQCGLGGAHSRGATAGKDDACGVHHTGEVSPRPWAS